MPTAVADEALADLVRALEELRGDALRGSVEGLLADRAFAPYVESSALLRGGFRVLGDGLRRVLFDGASAASELDLFLRSSSALSSLRARRVFVGRELLHRWRRSDPTRPFRVASVGEGAHLELLEFLGHRSVEPAAVQATIVDDASGVEEALQRARAVVTAAGVVLPVRGVVGELDALEASRIPPQDVVVVPHRFDFASDAELEQGVSRAVDLLLPGGELVLGHWHHDLTPRDRLVLEGFLGWRPSYRRPRSLVRTVRRIADAKGVSFAPVLRGPNVYLVLQRPR